MKKLMFAMAIAATVGFAQAEGTPIGTTTTFDPPGFTADTAFDTSVNTDWTNNTDTAGTVDATVKAYETPGSNGANYLQLDGVQNLGKVINTAIDTGLYIDTMVRFTATTDAQQPGEEDKLMVWLRENEGAGENGTSTYTLMVTAGYFNSEEIGIIAKDYETDAVVVPDIWYNLKVKAIANVDTAGLTEENGLPAFVVFIDGNPVFASGENNLPTDDLEVFGNSKYVTVDDKCALFPSLLEIGGTGNDTITQLAFSGSGAIDTVGAFRGDCDPDPVVPTTYAVTYTGAENVTVVTDPADTTALAVDATVAFTVTPASTHEYATVPTGWTAGANGAITMTYTVVAGQNVVTIPAPTAKSGWVDPADEQAIAKIEGKQAAEAYPSLAGTAVAAVDAKKLTIWATGKGNVDFSAATGINATAFLLDIANSSTAADIKAAEDTAKEAIKITAISFDENGNVVLAIPNPATYGNGKIVVEGKAQLSAAEWHNKVDTDKFFRTKLVLDEVAATPAVGD